MELLELKHKILDSFLGDKIELNKIIALVDNDKLVFPFNECEQGLYMPKFDLTYFDFIKRFNLSIDSIIGWSIFKISKLPLRRALHINEVKNADRLNDKNGQGVVISSPDGLIFFIVTFDTVTSMVKRVSLNIQINEKFNGDILACNIFVVNATIMALENSKLSKESKKEILGSIFLERTNKTKNIFIRNNIKYTSAISREEGFLFIADMLSEKSVGLIQKI